MNDAPRISVLISSYRNARFVAKKLEEIRGQTIFSQAEFLFIDTGSPECERDLFAPFCAAHPNCRVVATDDRRTLYQAWNLGWRAAAAPLICYSNMDDAMHPALLEKIVTAMEHSKADVCTALIAKQPMNEQWNDWSPKRIAALPLSTRFGAFMAWRAGLRDVIGEFDERFVAGGDKEFWHRASTAKLKMQLVPQILYLYTRNPQSLSKDTRESPAWQREKELLANVRWPRSLRWKVRLFRCRRRIDASFGIVPVATPSTR